jgi:hypothetical protein
MNTGIGFVERELLACTTEYLPGPAGGGWWQLVPIWDPIRP